MKNFEIRCWNIFSILCTEVKFRWDTWRQIEFNLVLVITIEQHWYLYGYIENSSMLYAIIHDDDDGERPIFSIVEYALSLWMTKDVIWNHLPFPLISFLLLGTLSIDFGISGHCALLLVMELFVLHVQRFVCGVLVGFWCTVSAALLLVT